MIHYYLTHCPTKTLTLTHPLIHHILSFKGDNRYAQSHLWPELIGGEVLLFLWAVEVSFPHPNSLLARQLVAQGRGLGGEGKSRSSQENNNGEDGNEDDVDCGDDEEDNEGNDHIMPDEADYDDDEIDDGSGLEVGVKLGAGAFVSVNNGIQLQPQQPSLLGGNESDTSNHADAENGTSILPISPLEGASPTAQTVFRSVGGLGKEHVTVSIAEPLYFELFRCCHQEEWNQRNINSNNNSNNHNGNNNNNNNNNNGSGNNSDNSINTHSPLPS